MEKETKVTILVAVMLLVIAVGKWWDSLFWLRLTNLIFISTTAIATYLATRY